MIRVRRDTRNPGDLTRTRGSLLLKHTRRNVLVLRFARYYSYVNIRDRNARSMKKRNERHSARLGHSSDQPGKGGKKKEENDERKFQPIITRYSIER